MLPCVHPRLDTPPVELSSPVCQHRAFSDYWKMKEWIRSKGLWASTEWTSDFGWVTHPHSIAQFLHLQIGWWGCLLPRGQQQGQMRTVRSTYMVAEHGKWSIRLCHFYDHSPCSNLLFTYLLSHNFLRAFPSLTNIFICSEVCFFFKKSVSSRWKRGKLSPLSQNLWTMCI